MKKIIAITMMIVTIIVTTNRAYAMPVEPIPPDGGGWIPEVIDGFVTTALDGSAKTGTPIDIVMLILASLSLVGVTTKLAVDDIRDGGTVSRDYLNHIIKTGDWVKEEVGNMLDGAVWVYDTSVSLLDVIIMGDTYDLKEFFFPSDTVINFPRDLSLYIRDCMTHIYGIPSFTPGTYDISFSVFLGMALENGLDKNSENYNTFIEELDSNIFKAEENVQKEYVIINKVNNVNLQKEVLSLKVLNSNIIDINTEADYINGKYWTIITSQENDENILNVLTFNYRTKKIFVNNYDGQSFYTMNKPTKFKEDYLDNPFENYIYNSFPMRIVLDEHVRTFAPNNNNIIVKESDIQPLLDLDPAEDIFYGDIHLNDYFLDIGNHIDLDTMTDTDELLREIIHANERAIKNGSTIIENPLIDTDTTPDLPFPLQWLWDGLKAIFEWLFVPSELAIENAVQKCKEKMDNQAGILTYPLTLVIEFLIAVSQLDNSNDFIMTIPEIKYKNHMLYAGTSFNYSAYIRDNNLGTAQMIVYYIGNFIMVLGILNMAKRKGDEIIRGI